MKPRCSSVSSDGGYKVLCNFNLSDVSKDKDEVGHVPDKNLSQYLRPKMPCSLTAIENAFVPSPECFENSKYLLTAVFKTIKAAHPDFRFDTVDIVLSSRVLLTMFYMCLRNKMASLFGAMTFELFGNTLIISFDEEKERRKYWNEPSGNYLLRSAGSTKPYHDLVRAVKYDLGGLSCMIVHAYDTTTRKPNKRHQKKRNANKHSSSECNTANFFVEHITKMDPAVIFEYLWFGRVESYVVAKVSKDSTRNKIWLRDLTLAPKPAPTE
ncbi:hypothetical protein EDB82DRAFT_529695 [Fusarium venenatum]|nr:hypothetical protein EDB82DRAFT_529695 [Fusarium venenatum]